MSQPAQFEENIITSEEVAQHDSRESCWIIVRGCAWPMRWTALTHTDGKVYDVTEFLPEHPGGSRIILKYAGKDATDEYDPIHPPDAITENLPPSKHLGAVDPGSVEEKVREMTAEERETAERHTRKPPLSECLSLHDIETVARYVLPDKAWMYYSSGADDEITMRANHNAYHRWVGVCG